MSKILSPALMFASTMSIFAQGSLTPPGAPAATMRTLLQIEPRTPISAATTINTPGSYYLTQTISVSAGNGISIVTSNVTLDLNGFTISSSENPAVASTSAIFINPGVSNVTILNGHVNSGVSNSGGPYVGSGFGNGITYGGSGPNNVRVRGVNVYGVLSQGIYLGFNGTTVENCTVVTAGGYGIYADSVSNSMGRNTASAGILANSALNCTGNSNASHGVQATTATNCNAAGGGSGHGVTANTALNCYGLATGSGNGVSATTATNCNGTAANGSGIYANVANGCAGSSTGGTGVQAVYIASNCYGTSTNFIGLQAVNAENCYGLGNTSNGLVSDRATNCYGYSGGSLNGLTATQSALNCFGQSASGTGLFATSAIGCYAISGSPSGAALGAQTAAFCSAQNTGGGPAISSSIATGCVTFGGSINATHKYLSGIGPDS